MLAIFDKCEVEQYKVESSTKTSIKEVKISSGRSLIKIRNKVGPRTEP